MKPVAMSSIRAVLNLGTRRWGRLTPFIRPSADTCHKESSFCMSGNGGICQFSSKEGKPAYEMRASQEAEGLVSSVSQTGKPDKEDQVNDSLDLVDSLMEHSDKILQRNYIKTCDYLLTDWGRQAKQSQNAGAVVKLSNIVTPRLKNIVQFVSTPSAPSELRFKCLILLLSEDKDSRMTTQLLNKTLEDVASLPIKTVIDIIQVLTSGYQTSLRTETRRKLVTMVVNQRWYEIPPKHIVFFMYQLDEIFNMREITWKLRSKDRSDSSVVGASAILGNTKESNLENIASYEAQNTEALKDDGLHEEQSSAEKNEEIPVLGVNIETRANSVAHDLKVKDLARIITILAKWRNRNETLISNIVNCLYESDLSEFTFLQLNNLLYAFSVLNIHKDDILGKMTSYLAQMTPPSAAMACSALVSLSHLRWNDAILISQYLQYLDEHISDVTVKDARNILVSLANLYALPKNEMEANLILKLTAKVLEPNISPDKRLHFAWCLAILLSLSAELGDTLLQTDMVNQLVAADTNDSKQSSQLTKLLAVNTAFQYEVKGYLGPLLPEELLQSPENAPASETDSHALHSEFLKTLVKFVDITKYCKLRKVLKGGVIADAAMCADRSGEVRPLDYTPKEGDVVFNVAIQLVPFSGVLSRSQTPSGPYAMTARHLKYLNYVPVQIIYSDLKASKNMLEKVSIIKTRIREAVQEAEKGVIS